MKTIALITQRDLQTISDLEAKIEKAKLQLDALKSEHEDVEAPVMSALLGSAHSYRVEPGVFMVHVDWNERRSVSWKGVVIARLGDGVADKILRETPVTRVPYLVVKPVIV